VAGIGVISSDSGESGSGLVTVGLKVPSRLLFLFAIWGAENLAQKLAIWGFPGVDFREVEKKNPALRVSVQDVSLAKNCKVAFIF
jgi:hypothetical protein